MRTTLSIGQIIDEWLANADIRQISKISYRRKIELFFRWLKSRRSRIEDADRSDVLAYKAEISDRLRENTVDSYMRAIKSFYAYCEERNYCHNIAAGIRASRRVYYHAKEPLSENQAIELLESINVASEIGLRDKLIISLMLFYGLRSCEVERLKVSDIDQNHVIKVIRKGRNDKADIRISTATYDLISEYVSCRDVEPSEHLIKCHSRNQSNDYLTRQAISKIVKRHLRNIGVDSPKITAHSLRHTCASLMILSGEPLETIRDVLGHTATNTTRIYTNTASKAKLMANSPSLALERKLIKKQ